MQRRPNIVIVSSFSPWPVATGSTQRIHSLGQWLSKHAQVSILLPQRIRNPRKPIPNYDFILGGNKTRLGKITFDLLSNIYSLYCRIRKKSPNFSTNIHKFHNYLQDYLYKKHLQKIKPDLVLCEKYKELPNLYNACSSLKVPIILDANDFVSKRQEKEVELGLRKAQKISLEEEIAIWNLASIVIAIQPEEYSEIIKYISASKVICLPQAFPYLEVKDKLPKRDMVILIVASTAAPNIQGIGAFLKHQWPIVMAKNPKAELHVVGNISKVISPDLLKTKQTKFYGYLEDLSHVYQQATIVLNPVTYGSGLKIKSVEALRYGKCLLSTPEGLEGMPEVKELMPSSPPDKLGEAINLLLKDGNNIIKYEKIASEIFSKNYTPSACYSPLLRLLKERGWI